MSPDVLDQCREKLAELNSLRPIGPEEQGRILQKLRLEWDFHSNHIEGNALSYGETRALILHGLTAQGKPLRDHFEMTGHHEAVLWIEDLVAKKAPLTEAVIRQLHQLVLQHDHEIQATTVDGESTKLLVEVGKYKTLPNHVNTATGAQLFFAPPMEVPMRMRELVDWYQMRQDDGTDPIEVASSFHHRFTRIHPFADGNGRVARLVSNFILMMAGYPPMIVRAQEKSAYFAALSMADAGDTAAFTEYVASRLLESLDLVIRGARGEDIDELGDVDKQLALLKKRFETSKGRVNVLRSPERAQRSWEEWIRPMFTRFISRSDNFREFYMSVQPLMVIQGAARQGDVESLLSFGQEKIATERKIALQVRFNVIRTRENVDKSFTSELSLVLHPTHVEVRGGKSGALGEVDWDKAPDPQDIARWIAEEEKRHVTFLENVFATRS